MAATGQAGALHIALLKAYQVEVDEQTLASGLGAGQVGRKQHSLSADGRSVVALDLTLPGNAVVRALDVELRADRAEWTALGDAGQVRATPAGSGTDKAVVIDFGAARTVAGVGAKADSNLTIKSVTLWNGVKFDESAYSPTGSATSTKVVVFPGEFQSQKLQIVVTGAGADDDFADALAVQLPELPADIELRLDGGPPVFSQPGPVRDGFGGWQTGEDGRTTRTVSLAEVLAPLVGDPGDPSNRTVRVTLAARIPGLLEIAESGREVDTVWAADLGPDGAADLEFEAEGFADVPLGLPARASGFVTEVRATIAAAPPPERARPPVGPPAGARAELLLGPDRAACVRVPADLPFADLAAVRLPLAAGPSGAEVQVGFLAAGARPSDPPGELVPTSLAKPVVLPPAPAGAAAGAAAAGEQWTSFTLAAPLPLPQLTGAPRPWLAVFVSRGEATWGMAAGEGFTGFALPTDIRRGPAGGPWEPLPAYLAAPPGSAARVHFVGRASKQEPVAPLAIEAAVADSPWRSDAPDRRDVVPSAKGARATLACNLALSPPSGAVLRVTALCAGTVTIRNLETVVSTAPAAPQEE